MAFKVHKIKHNLKDMISGIVASTSGLKKEILTRGMEIVAGLESNLLNPDTLLGDKGATLELYDILMLDDRIKFAIDLKKHLVLSVPNKVVSASDEKKDVEIAEFVQDNFDNLNNPSWTDSLDNLLDAMVYGHKEGEVIWNDQVINGKWVWDKIKFQHPVLFDFEYDEKDNLKTVYYGRNYGGDTEIDVAEFENKFLCMVYPYLKDGNWYGDSDLREVYFEWWSKYNIKRWRNTYLQNYGMPIPMVTYVHKETTKQELNDIDEMLKKWQDQQYIKIPANRDKKTGEMRPKIAVDFKDANVSRGTDQYEEASKEIDKAITRKILIPDRIGFTDDKFGSQANATQLFDILLIVISRIHKRLEDVVNPKVKQIVDLNFGGVEDYPRWEFDRIDKQIADAIWKILFDKKVIDRREKWIRPFMGIPELSEKEQAEIDEAKEEDMDNMPFGPGAQGPPQQGPPENQQGPPGAQKKMKRGVPFDSAKIKNGLDQLENDFIADYDEVLIEQEQRLLEIIGKKTIVEDKDYKAIKKLKIVKTDLKKLFSTYYAKMYFKGKTDAIEGIRGRLKKQFKNYVELQVDADELAWLNRDWINRHLEQYGDLGTLSKADKLYLTNLRDKAFFITGQTEDRILKTVYHQIDNGIKSGLTTASVVDKIKGELSADRKKYALTIARTNEADAYNTGRMNFYTQPNVSPFIEAFQYSAILDDRVTEFCEEHDGQIITKNDPNFGSIQPPNHFNCRSVLIPIMVGESEIKGDYYYEYQDKYDKWGTDITNEDAVRPAAGFGG